VAFIIYEFLAQIRRHPAALFWWALRWAPLVFYFHECWADHAELLNIQIFPLRGV